MLELTGAVGEPGPGPPVGAAVPPHHLTPSIPPRARDRLARHRPLLAMLARLAALGLVLRLFVFPQLSGLGSANGILRQIHGPWVWLAVTVELGSLAFYTLATRILLPPRTRPPYDRVARIDLSAIALGHCLPDGGAAGTALSWRLLVADGVPGMDAGLTKLAQGLGSAVVLLVLTLAALGSGAVWSGGLSTWALVPAVVIAAILAVIVLATRVVASATARDRARGALGLVPRVGARLVSGVDDLYRRDVIQHLRGLVRQPGRFTAAAGLSGGNWALDALALWASLRIFGPGVGLQGLAVVYAIAVLGTWVPLTPSGLGVSESLMIPALLAFGAPHAQAVLGVLTWRLFAYWLPIPIGALAYATLGRRSP